MQGHPLIYGSFISGVVASALVLASVAHAADYSVCRPKLTITGVQFSEMTPPTLERKWTAVVLVDASHCATTSGRFAIAFSRLKETAPDLEFREQFTWRSPSVVAAVDFWADEAVERYWLSDVAACPCRD